MLRHHVAESLFDQARERHATPFGFCPGSFHETVVDLNFGLRAMPHSAHLRRETCAFACRPGQDPRSLGQSEFAAAPLGIAPKLAAVPQQIAFQTLAAEAGTH
jgi:hypothetical protein